MIQYIKGKDMSQSTPERPQALFDFPALIAEFPHYALARLEDLLYPETAPATTPLHWQAQEKLGTIREGLLTIDSWLRPKQTSTQSGLLMTLREFLATPRQGAFPVLRVWIQEVFDKNGFQLVERNLFRVEKGPSMNVFRQQGDPNLYGAIGWWPQMTPKYELDVAKRMTEALRPLSGQSVTLEDLFPTGPRRSTRVRMPDFG